MEDQAVPSNKDRLSHLRALGSRVLSEANDLKRTPEALAAELGFDLATVRGVIEGRADLGTVRDLVFAMTEKYPIALGRLWIGEDDSDEGVRIMTAAQSEETSRIFERTGRDGSVGPYYEYRDTAMSRAAPFKPEWIKELRLVSDADPENQDVVYNNGHLLHQTTFFIGAVNFYWESDGRYHCAELDTGDSNYITPFVRHSFASRDPDQAGVIVAVTYSGALGVARDEFVHVDPVALGGHAGDLRDEGAFACRLQRHLDAESLTPEDLDRELAGGSATSRRIEDICTGSANPTPQEVDAIAEVLNIRPADLMVTTMTGDEEVVVRRRRDTGARNYPMDGNAPAYQLTELARSRHQPYLKGFDVAVLGTPAGDFRHGLHEYVYNYGGEAVELVWNGNRRATLSPGDSAYIRPLVSHRFSRAQGAGPGQLAVVRVPGLLTDAVLDEYAAFAPAGRERAVAETEMWF